MALNQERKECLDCGENKLRWTEYRAYRSAYCLECESKRKKAYRSKIGDEEMKRRQREAWHRFRARRIAEQKRKLDND
jgi:hypothetical protein